MMAINFFAKRSAVPETKSNIPLGVVNFTDMRAQWSGRTNHALTRNGFLNNPIGFRCVKLIAETASALELLAMENGQRVTGHPMLSVLKKPNSSQGQSSFFEELYGQIILTGNAFIEAVRNEEGEIRGVHVLRSERMSVVPGKDGWPIAYEYTVGRQKFSYDIRDEFSPILHIKTFHPQDDHYGLSPLLAAASAVDVHNAASQSSKALLDNAARPSGALVYKGVEGDSTMTDTQYSRLVDEIEANHQGARNAGRPMLLEGGLDWKPMSFSPSDMEFHQTKSAASREIALALGVPPMILGLPGDNTYSNYQEANRAFYRLTVLPLVRHVLTRLSSWFAESEDGEIEISADSDKIPALREDRDAEWKRISEASFLTDAEKRRLLGFPELEMSVQGDDDGRE